MTNIDRAADIIELAARGAHTADGHILKMRDHTAQIIAESLADAGLLTPEPQVIRTRDELAALDPDTVVTDGILTVAAGLASLYAQIGMLSVPVAVIAAGDQARAARQAPEEA